MTTKNTTGLLAKSNALDLRTTGERLFQIAFGAIQWPWLLASLHGGSQAEKAALLDRVGLPPGSLPNLGSWKADTYLLHRIVDEIEHLRPQTVVELGSGATSLVIAQALTANGAGQLHSYDQHEPFIKDMQQWLEEFGLGAQFRHAPLTHREVGWPGLWYDLAAIPPAIDMLVIDGPPWAVHPYARGMAEVLFPRIVPGGVVMLDDAARPGERVVARRWRRRWPNIQFNYEGQGSKGLLIGRKSTI